MKNCKKRKRYLHPSSLEAAVYWQVVVLGVSQRVVADEFETSQASICRMCRRVRAWLFGCEESLLARQQYGHTQSRIPEAYARTEHTQSRGINALRNRFAPFRDEKDRPESVNIRAKRVYQTGPSGERECGILQREISRYRNVKSRQQG